MPTHVRHYDGLFSFEVERLEDRCLLAGFVQVVESAGQILLRGDRLANAVEIHVAEDGNLRMFAVEETQFQWMDAIQTELELPSTENLRIKLRGGDDRILISGSSPQNLGVTDARLSIRGSAGDDEVQLVNLSLTESLFIETSGGDDWIQLADVHSTTGGRMVTGSADDLIQMENTHFIGDVDLRANGGDDGLEFTTSISAEQLRVSLGGGEDRLRTGDALATVQMTAAARLRLGAGRDELISNSSANSSTASYYAGSGRDRLLAAAESPGIYFGFDILAKPDMDHGQPSLVLSLQDATYNTQLIESFTLNGMQAIIPAGAWPVRPISIDSYGSITGLGVAISELRLEIESPTRFAPQHIMATVVQNDPSQFTVGVLVRDVTLNGNYANIDWQHVYNDGNAFGIYARAASEATFTDIEIKNCWTDGIFISTVLGYANNTKNSTFERIVIHDCGRQGVSIVGGEYLQLNDFEVYAIGRGNDLGTSPRSALDIEPERGVQRLARHITVTNWNIYNVGQGILVSATHSSEPAKQIALENIRVDDLDGPQILAVRDVDGLIVTNFLAENHRPANGGLGVLFRNTTGDVDGLSVIGTYNTNYPLRIDGTSDMVIRNVVLDGAGRGALQIGGEPGDPLDATHVQLSLFEFRNISTANVGLPLGRISSAGMVVLSDGLITDIGETIYTMQLFSDVYFYDSVFAAGANGIFDPAGSGQVFGTGNNWN